MTHIDAKLDIDKVIRPEIEKMQKELERADRKALRETVWRLMHELDGFPEELHHLLTLYVKEMKGHIKEMKKRIGRRPKKT